MPLSSSWTPARRSLRPGRAAAGFLYQSLYVELERKRRTRLYPWPKVIVGKRCWEKRKKARVCEPFADYRVEIEGIEPTTS